MDNQITIEEALELVEFELGPGGWRVKHVNGNVLGDVCGDVWGNVRGDVRRNVLGNVKGSVGGNVGGTINGRQWQFVETPKEKLKRLIDEGADRDEILKALNQLEDNC